MNQKIYQKIYHVNVNVDLIEKNVIQINGEITINLNVSHKNFMYVKRIIFGSLLHVVVKMANIWQVLWMIEPTLMKRKQPVKRKLSIFYLHFY